MQLNHLSLYGGVLVVCACQNVFKVKHYLIKGEKNKLHGRCAEPPKTNHEIEFMAWFDSKVKDVRCECC